MNSANNCKDEVFFFFKITTATMFGMLAENFLQTGLIILPSYSMSYKWKNPPAAFHLRIFLSLVIPPNLLLETLEER
jgi:hypothetical protein